MREGRVLEFGAATLMVSTSNGYSVQFHGVYVGFIHASLGNQWNAYRRRVDAPPEHLGAFDQVEAVHQVVCGLAAPAEKAVV